MTRITNFGRKRTYLQSTLGYQAEEEPQPSSSVVIPNEADNDSGQPPKKKRNRTKRTKNATDDQDTSNSAPKNENFLLECPSGRHQQPQKQRKKSKKDKQRIDKDDSVRSRRLKRIAERNIDTTCYACREKGHSAKDCPKEGMDKKRVGICYRCGSIKHNLSRCRKPEDPFDPLPFATCFVCDGKGHLASGCLQNKDKGVYPNGGCCKICRDTSHLAKDCGMRKKDVNALTQVMGVEGDIGGDEDDFHIIGRRKQELVKEEKRSMDTKASVMESFGRAAAAPKTKKVVYF